MSTNGWEEWSRYVLKNIEEIKTSIDDVKKDLQKDRENLLKTIQSNREEILLLKLKCGIWGLAGGAVPVAITLFIMYVRTQ